MLVHMSLRTRYQDTGKVITSQGCMGHDRVHKQTMSIPIACFIPAIMPLKALLTVPYRRNTGARRPTDADILEQGIGSLLTSRGCKGLIEHIIQYMYSLCSPSWGAVTVVGYVFTDLRIYPPPSPSRRPTRGRASANQNVAGTEECGRFRIVVRRCTPTFRTLCWDNPQLYRVARELPRGRRARSLGTGSVRRVSTAVSQHAVEEEASSVLSRSGCQFG